MGNFSENLTGRAQEAFVYLRENASVPRGGCGPLKATTESKGLDRLQPKDLPVPHSRRPGAGQMALPGVGLFSQSPLGNRRFTFEQFVVGTSNRFAFEAAWAVATERRALYNPLYLYGDSGLGKSHLCGAIGNQIHSSEPGVQILNTTAEQFLDQMVVAIRKNEMGEFKEKYRRRCDVLVIDGVHFFSGKEKTQAELSHTLDHLMNSGKQMILTGTVPPQELRHMRDGLISRLGGGLVVDIQPPEVETRRRILHQKAGLEGVSLPDDVVDLIASRIGGSVRRLEGLLVNMIAKSSLLSRSIDLDLAREVLGSFQISESQMSTIDSIQKLVARQYHLEVTQMISRSRKRSICHPRQLAMYLCRAFTDESLDSIGRAFCRDHASVIHSIGVIERKLREKAKIRREVEFLTEKLKTPQTTGF